MVGKTTQLVLKPKNGNGNGVPKQGFFSKLRMGIGEVQKGARAIRTGQLESARVETQHLREQIRLERERGKLERLRMQVGRPSSGMGLDFGFGFGRPKQPVSPLPKRRKVRQSKVIRIRRRGKLIKVRIV